MVVLGDPFDSSPPAGPWLCSLPPSSTNYFAMLGICEGWTSCPHLILKRGVNSELGCEYHAETSCRERRVRLALGKLEKQNHPLLLLCKSHFLRLRPPRLDLTPHNPGSWQRAVASVRVFVQPLTTVTTSYLGLSKV